MPCLKPPFLNSGDSVIIVAPARKVSFLEIEPAIKVLESWNLKVIKGKNLFETDNQFAGNDGQRLSDMQAALDDTDIKAIFCARGGYGTPRIIDDLTWDKFIMNPKWLVGFSDITILLNKIFQLGFCSLHAPMPLFFSKQEYSESIISLKSYLFGGLNNFKTEPHVFNREGNASGKLLGGNLTMMVNSIGTESGFYPEGTILILEDLDEYLYHIDRMMVQLKRAGILARISGLIVGHFGEMKDNTIPFGKSAYEIITSHIKEYNYPVTFNFPVGHYPQNMPIPIGNECKLNVSNEGVKLEFS